MSDIFQKLDLPSLPSSTQKEVKYSFSIIKDWALQFDKILTSIVKKIDKVLADISIDHILSTEAHGATGAVVGTTNIQTLSNKTLNLPIANKIHFDTSYTATGVSEGDMFWNKDEGTVDVAMPGGTVRGSLFQEMYVPRRCKNNTGSTIPNGSLVYINGVSGTTPTITLADADLEATSTKTIGMATEDIANNGQGFVTTFGIVRDVNTNAYSVGTILWLSGTAGGYTSTRPPAPAHAVFVGYVWRQHATQGEIFTNIQNGYELDELHDVLIGTKTSGDFLGWNGTTWVNTRKIGDGTNYTEFEADGTLKFTAGATVFTDLTAAVTGARTNGPGVTLNTIEQTLDFVTVAALDDYAYLSYQLNHAWKSGSNISPHIHWEQAETVVPNFLFQYRWQKNGSTKTTAWTNLKCNTPVFTRTAGTLNQICGGASITPPIGYGISDIIQLRLIRDTANSSTLFTGADPYTTTVAVSAIDIHYEIDTIGSRTEYTK